MKSLYTYILEAEIDDNDKEKDMTRRGNIKFTIWEAPDKKVKWIENNNKYQQQYL